MGLAYNVYQAAPMIRHASLVSRSVDQFKHLEQILVVLSSAMYQNFRANQLSIPVWCVPLTR